MGLKNDMSITSNKPIYEVADAVWNLQKLEVFQLRIEELKVLHGEYAFKMRKGVPVKYVFDISGAGSEGEIINIRLKPSSNGTAIKISSKSFLPTDLIAKPGNNKVNVEEIVNCLSDVL